MKRKIIDLDLFKTEIIWNLSSNSNNEDLENHI